MNFFFYRLLDREQVGDEEATLDDDEEDGFLKAFKVLSILYYHVHWYYCEISVSSNLIFYLCSACLILCLCPYICWFNTIINNLYIYNFILF